jgi:hypothetical protein
MIKSSRKREARHVTYTRQKVSAYKFWVGKPEEKTRKAQAQMWMGE